MVQADHGQQAERLNALRAEMKKRGLAAFVVPHADQHQGEYLPAYAERLAWLTGFSGSAGAAVITADAAALFVDGRYTLQATVETSCELYDHCHVTDMPPGKWLAAALKSEGHSDGAVIGFDPWLHTDEGLKALRKACEPAGVMVQAIEGQNPIDLLWTDQPAPPAVPVMRQPVEFAGETVEAKRRRIAILLRDDKVDAAVLSAPESVAWLLNLRGGDVPFTPLALAFAIIHANASVELFIDPAKTVSGLGEYLGESVRIAAPNDLEHALTALSGKVVLVDQASCAVWISQRLREAGAAVKAAQDPCALPRACKNSTELAGMRESHIRDGVALCRFLAWVDGKMAAEVPILDEIAAADHLESLRREGAYFRDLSFPTISGSGPHGAVVHYRVSDKTNRVLQRGELFLVDSGGQYLDGTTDVTRTIALGAPSDEMRRRYTQVLKGHIASSRARFPQGTCGHQLDALARQFLWADGVDYDHGTGHGVGSYLSVHEGPQRISKVPTAVALKPGMVLSNEPGYYKAGAFGIRIENLVVVTAMEPPPEGAEKPLLFFETLTLAPYDRRLIDVTMLAADELSWIDAYHRRVRDLVGQRLSGTDAVWMDAMTTPLA